MYRACNKSALPLWIGLMLIGLLVWQNLPAIAGQSGTQTEKSFQQLTVEQAEKWIKEGAQIIDVREPEEFVQGHVKGAKNIPLGDIEKRMKEIKKDKPVLLVCRSGRRSAIAAERLIRADYPPDKVGNLKGGMLAWQAEGKPIERNSSQ